MKDKIKRIAAVLLMVTLVLNNTSAQAYADGLLSIFGVFGTEKLETTVLTASGETYEISVSYDQEAQIPEGAVLNAVEILEGTPEYEEYVAEAKAKVASEDADTEEVKDVTYARFFDITILYNGEEVQPAKPVQVEIKLQDDKEEETSEEIIYNALHFTEEGPETVDAEFGEGITFEAEGFSVWGIVGTETIIVPFTASDGNTYEVTVNYGKDADIPANAKLEVSEVSENSSRYNGYVEQAAEAIYARAIDLQYVKLLDISIVDENGNKVELNAPVNVQIKLLDKDQAEETTQVVHFEGTDETPVVMESSVVGDAVNFATDGFSIYAVVDTGDTGEYARMTIEFYDHEGNLLETAYVKNDDTLAEIVEIISDPNPNVPSGKLFKGWMQDKQNYTVEDADNAKTLGEIREWAEAKEITENETVKFYSVVYSSFKVTYKDGENIVVGTENKLYPHTTTSIPYTVNMAYTAPDDTHNFEGWLAVDGMSNITSASYKIGEGQEEQTVTIDTSDPNAIYPNGASLTITGNVTFGVSAPEGHWLVFHENGKGATYNAPRFIKSGERTSAPATPERYGYTFGGWYTDEACTDDSRFSFGGTISETTHVYAKWTAVSTASYTVLIWKENLDGTGYDFEESVNLTGNTNTTVSTVVARGTGNNRYARVNNVDKQYEGFHLDTFDENVTIVPEGTTVVNVYYDRNEYTFTFQATGYIYTETTGNTGTQYGYYDDEYVQLYYNNGTWYRTRTGSQWFGYNYSNPYYGTRYTRSGGNSTWSTIHTVTRKYQADISDIWSFTGSNGITYPQTNPVTSWTPQNNSQYTARITRMEVMPATDLTFRHTTSNNPTRYFHYYVEALPGDENTRIYNGREYSPYSGLDNGTLINDFNVVYYNDDFWNLRGFERQVITKSNNQVVNLTAGNNITWTNLNNNYGGDNNHLYFYYLRQKYPINYMDGVYVDGNGNPINETNRGQLHVSEDIFYQADISSYNKGGTNYYEPTYTGYVLEGWYLDDACNQPANFDKMPEDGITVYAKWRQVQYRVFLHPNVPESDLTLSWGDEELDEDHKQQMNFRVSLGDTVSVPTGLRTEYEMIGWYLDEGCTQLFNADNYILNETTVTDPFDKTTHMTDPMNKYGNITNASEAYNADVNRNWITKEFNLYAKWRKVIDGAEGISVVYNAGDGSGTPPTDNSLYLDTAAATALTASQIVPPTPAEGSDVSEYIFDYWVLQTWDEQQQKYVDTSTYIYPGDTFVVLLDNAKKERKLDDEGNPISVDGVAQYNYTVQLRAAYVPKEIATPTHIDWFANNGTGAKVSDSKDGKLKINEPVAIRPADTFTYAGHKFLGWARIEDTETGTHPDWELTEADLWLIYDEATGEFKVKQEGTTELRTVSQIAADERNPYHDLYAVWEKMTYTVSIQKTVVGGTAEDGNSAFTIAYAYDDTSLTDGSVDIKHGQEAIVISEEVPYGTVVTVSETGYTAFEQSYTASRKTDDQGVEITPVDVAHETTGEGDFKITGDTVITVTNTRKVQDVIFGKTLEESQITDDTSSVMNAEFTLTDGTNTYTANPKSDGTVTFNDVPFGTYTLRETVTPTGYAAIQDHTVIVDRNGFSIQLNDTDIGVEGVYTINDPKAETGSITLVKTNEDGTKQLEGAIFEISTYNAESQRYLDPTNLEGVGRKDVTGLKLGTKYQLKEIQAPNGYILLGDVYYFQIKLDGTVQITDESGTVVTNYSNVKISLNDKTISVKNEPGQALPHTGGTGTLPYTLGGLMLVIASALMYGFRMRRRERRLN